MSEKELLLQLLKQQQQQMAAMEQQMTSIEQQHQEQMAKLVEMIKPNADGTGAALNTPPAPAGTPIPSFSAFDPSAELWTDYWARFSTFIGAHSVPESKQPQIFLTNQTPAIYKTLANLAQQQSPPIGINALSIQEICDFMKDQFHPTRYVVRERFKFWSDTTRKPGETVHELAARIRQDAVTCDFPSITDPLDEAMRTRFICSINNEAVLKALFKMKDDELSFARAIEVANETEEAAKVAKETVYGTKTTGSVSKIQRDLPRQNSYSKGTSRKSGRLNKQPRKSQTCRRCDGSHASNDCRFKDSTCHYCGIKGHIQTACLRKKKGLKPPSNKADGAKKTYSIRGVKDDYNPIMQQVSIRGQQCLFEVDTGATCNIMTHSTWRDIGKPSLLKTSALVRNASGQDVPVFGTLTVPITVANTQKEKPIDFYVCGKMQHNLLGLPAIHKLQVNALDMLNQRNGIPDTDNEDNGGPTPNFICQLTKSTGASALQAACQQLCKEFPELFKEELGCLKDFELEVKFKKDAKPIFCKPRSVPFALMDDLNQAIDAGVQKGVWKWVQFNDYGTPVVPVKKALRPGQTKPSIRVCGDYSVSVNPQLEVHRQPIPLPEDLMLKLCGGYCFTKIDLADAYNQIKLAPESQRKLALSTHRGVLLQLRLPFGISSAVGEFQAIMERITQDLTGVAVYLDDILVSGKNAQDHLKNLRQLLQRLQDKGLRCRYEKCSFAQETVEYLGHQLSSDGIAKGKKVEAVKKMPPPTNVTELRSFLGSVNFYNKFLPNLSSEAEPLHSLTHKGTAWKWGTKEQACFQHLKDLLCNDVVLAHFNPAVPVGISCDASEVGVGVVLFHRYQDGTERPIAYASKTLTDTQRRYSQIQREALAIVFGLTKFHQFLYGRRIIIVSDHKPLLAIFSPTRGTPTLAANRLARWALQLSQYDYKIEYRKTADHGNADALSRLPSGHDSNFDGEEDSDDKELVCMIQTISSQINPLTPGLLAKETHKDSVLSQVMKFTHEGWPPKQHQGQFDQEDETDGSTQPHYKVEDFRKIASSLSTLHGCLLNGSRVVVPASLQKQVMDLIHLGHFGMQRMKQLARSAVYWPRIDEDLEKAVRTCSACQEHQSKPAKLPNHPWMLPEKPWSRIHIDHAINFMGTNWLVVIDAYSKYLCIHPTSSTSTKTSIELLEQDFAHFGNPHAIVSDNATSFTSAEFQDWCKVRGITHLTGAPYWPATNGIAERAVQTFKQALKKSSLPPRRALQQFLMQYRRTPLLSGLSPSQLLNGRQLRCQLDALLPSPAQWAQGRQAKEATKAQEQEAEKQPPEIKKVSYKYQVGQPVYALYCGPRREKSPRWVPGTIVKVCGTRSVKVRIQPKGPIWHRHLEQLRPRFATPEDVEPGEEFHTTPVAQQETTGEMPQPESPPAQGRRQGQTFPSREYGADNPRRSTRQKHPPNRYSP